MTLKCLASNPFKTTHSMTISSTSTPQPCYHMPYKYSRWGIKDTSDHLNKPIDHFRKQSIKEASI